jgi:hypothetical protein
MQHTLSRDFRVVGRFAPEGSAYYAPVAVATQLILADEPLPVDLQDDLERMGFELEAFRLSVITEAMGAEPLRLPTRGLTQRNWSIQSKMDQGIFVVRGFSQTHIGFIDYGQFVYQKDAEDKARTLASAGNEGTSYVVLKAIKSFAAEATIKVVETAH